MRKTLSTTVNINVYVYIFGTSIKPDAGTTPEHKDPKPKVKLIVALAKPID